MPTTSCLYAPPADSPQTRAAKGFAVLTIFFILFLIPIERIAAREAQLVSLPALILTNGAESDDSQHPRPIAAGISAREQLRRRGSF